MQIPLHVQRLFRALPLPDKSMAFFVSTRRLLDFLRLMEFGRFRFVSGHEATGINSTPGLMLKLNCKQTYLPSVPAHCSLNGA
jgi:hypothetical protein